MKKPIKKRVKQSLESASALPQTAADRLGSGSYYDFGDDDLNTSLPNSFVSNRGDPNQISRSEECEMENNTSTHPPLRLVSLL